MISAGTAVTFPPGERICERRAGYTASRRSRRGDGIHDLERRRRHEALPDGGMIIVADIPTLSDLLFFPSRIRDEPVRFSRHIDIRRLAQAEEILIFFHELHAQTADVPVAAADRIEKNIA
jgi:hypothetical protein